MINISPVIPIAILIIVGVNFIEYLIKSFIGNDSQNKTPTKKVETKGTENQVEKERKKINNPDWSIKNESSSEKIKEEMSNSTDNIDKSYFQTKKGRMEDYMDDTEASIYENNDKTKIKRREKVTEDYPNEIKIGENKLFNKKNIKEDMLKGIVMKEILDKPRAKKPYKSIYKRK